MSIYDKGFITIIACALLLIAVAIPLALRKVPRNGVYGYRTRTTMANDEIWFDANAHFGRGLIIASMFGAFAGYLIYRFEPFSPSAYLPVSIFVLAVPSLVAALATARFIRAQDESL
ncbi:MAG: SdpI family protein [Betaproteobacteria bacterium]